MARPRKYPQELLDRGVRLALESERPIAHIARDLGINHARLHESLGDIPPLEYEQQQALHDRASLEEATV